MGRRAAGFLLGIALTGAVPASAGKVERSHPEIPEWMRSLPSERDGRVYFMGVKSGASSLEEGLEAADLGAAAQVVGFIRMRPDARFASRLDSVQRRVVDEIRTAKSALVEGALREDSYWEVRDAPRGKRVWDVWVLVSYPTARAELERRRLSEAEAEAGRVYRNLCAGLAPALLGSGLTVDVSGFKDRVGGARYGLSRVIETQLRDCLANGETRTVEAGRASALVTGEHWVTPERVMVSARVVSTADGVVLRTASGSFPREAVDASWLSEDAGPADEFLAAPGKARRPRAASGSLRIDSDPPGAAVTLDGGDDVRGVTPVTLHRIPPGTHSVILTLPGYVPASLETVVREGEQAIIEARLEQMTGSLRIVTTPRGASVTLNGDKGKTPVFLEALPIGVYAVNLRLDDHKPEDAVVTIEYGRETRLERELTEEPGTLAIFVTPPDSSIQLDGNLVGQTAARTLSFDGIAAGWRNVRVAKEGFVPAEWRVRVRPNATVSVSGVLKRSYERVRPSGEPWRLPRFGLNRPARMAYYNVLGGSLGSSGSGIRALEGRTYALGGALGIGTSLAARYQGGLTSRRQKTVVSGGVPRTSTQDLSVTFTSVFPLRLSFAPMALTYSAGGRRTAAVLEFFAEGCFWSTPSMPDAGLPDGIQLPRGNVFDFGVLLHAGLWAGVRAGVLKARMPSFTHGSDRYSAVNEARPYIAVQFDLGGFYVAD